VSDFSRTPPSGRSVSSPEGDGLKSDTENTGDRGYVGAFAEARRLGHHWAGEEHALLALSRREDPVGNALRAAGARPGRLEQVISETHAHADPPVERRETDSPALTPAMYSTLGRAEGLAAARGEEPTLDDLLVALLWHAGFGSSLLHRLGIDRTVLAARLADAGVAVPPGEPEPLDLRPRKRVDVPYEHLMAIVAALPARLPEGSLFGFNVHHETRRAWIVVGEEIDAEPLVAEVLAGSS
jgi:hypothetical protein